MKVKNRIARFIVVSFNLFAFYLYITIFAKMYNLQRNFFYKIMKFFAFLQDFPCFCPQLGLFRQCVKELSQVRKNVFALVKKFSRTCKKLLANYCAMAR